ncbi:MAG: hypothetical protein KJZ53_06835 [Anaerolineales bacterium]|nr:hypothetical protein [Anaerolineales bacterium]
MSNIPKYLGTKSIAQMYWCHQFFIFHSQEKEQSYKTTAESLVNNAIEWHRKAKAESVFLNGQEIAELSIAEVNTLLKQVNFRLGPISPSSVQILPNLSEHALGLFPVSMSVKKVGTSEFENWKKAMKNLEYIIFDNGEMQGGTIRHRSTPRERIFEAGVRGEVEHAEKYDEALGRFNYMDHIVIAAPDGLADEFAYEFKMVGNDFWMKFEKPVAITQANLYAYFFDKPQIRVQLRNRQTSQTTTIQQAMDKTKATNDLKKAMDLLNAKLAPVAPHKQKCPKCDYLSKCPIAPKQRIEDR